MAQAILNQPEEEQGTKEDLRNKSSSLTYNEEGSQEFTKHRLIEEVNDLSHIDDGEDAEDSKDRRRERSQPSMQSDGMGSLSQQMLDEGDPYENARREERLAKALPKGYLKNTQ